MRSVPPTKEPNGFALPLTISLLLMLAVILALVVYFARQSNELVKIETRREQSRQELLGVLNVVAYSMRTNPERWDISIPRHTINIANQEYEINIQSSAGLLDINTATNNAIENFFILAGASVGQARELGFNIIDWRDKDKINVSGEQERAKYEEIGSAPPRNGQFTNIDEVGMVMGFNPELSLCLAPFLTVDSSLPDIALSLAPEVQRTNSDVSNLAAIAPEIGGALEIGISRKGNTKKGWLTAVVRLTNDRQRPILIHEVSWQPPPNRDAIPDCFK